MYRNRFSEFVDDLIQRILKYPRRVVWGLRNFWRFRKEIWWFRDWDFYYSYSLFMKGLEELRDGIEKRANHEEYEDTVEEITAALEAWDNYANGFEKGTTWKEWEEYKNGGWLSLHCKLWLNARKWWD